MIPWLLSTRIGRAIGAALALLAGLLTFGAYHRRKGRTEGAERLDGQDKRQAADVRRRVEAVKERHDEEDRLAGLGDDDLRRVRDELRGRQDR